MPGSMRPTVSAPCVTYWMKRIKRISNSMRSLKAYPPPRVERVEPAYYLVWINEQRFLPGEFYDHFHDDHAPDVRAWLAQVEKQ